MIREQIPEGSLLRDSIRDFICSILACSASIVSSGEEEKGILLEFSESKDT